MNHTIGATIAALRKEHNWTQRELADKMGVTDKAVSKWERNLACPDIGTLPRLATLFGVSVDELMQVHTDTVEQTPARNADVRRLVQLILKAVATAMGVAVTVLSVLHTLDPAAGIPMLGIGLTCIGLLALSGGTD